MNRASETAETAWPAALSRAGPAFCVKYLWIWSGSAPGRGKEPSASACDAATPPMKLAPATSPLSA